MKSVSYVLFVLGALSIGPPAHAEVIVYPVDSDSETVIAAAKASRAVAGESKLDLAHSTLTLPYFEADPSSPDGATTFFGIRNSGNSTVTLDISYLDQAGNLQTIEAGTPLDPFQVLIRDLRSVAGLNADADGVRRGWVFIAGPPGAALSGDYFQVDAAENFATGSRLIGGDERCQLWDIRFLQGGGFDGGTTLLIFTDQPRGTGAADPFTLTFVVYNQSAAVFGSVGIKMDRNAEILPVGDLIAALPGGLGPPFGSLFAAFGLAPGGHVQAVYSALGRYSVGIKGNCLDDLP